MSRPTKAIIDTQAFRSNYQFAQRLDPTSNTIAVIKANGYGHGASELAESIADIAPCYAVACPEEVTPLRVAGIQQPILMLQGPYDKDDLRFAAEQACWLVIQNQQQVDWLTTLALKNSVKVFLKVDTGMHRLGFQPHAVPSIVKQLRQSRFVESDITLMTHLACSDDLNSVMTRRQIEIFSHLATSLQCTTSIANSAGIMHWKPSHATWNRPGIMLYGVSPTLNECNELTPVMSLCSEVIGLREINAGESVGYSAAWVAQEKSLIATVAAGYADGYPRGAGADMLVRINGQLAPIAGRVSMDMLCVDVSAVKGVQLGSKVELWGKHISVSTVAAKTGTIAYETLAGMPARVPRMYL